MLSLRAPVAPTRTSVVTRATAPINPGIKKSEPKVVDTIVAAEMTDKQVVMCRCWRSGTFPLCNGSHVAHNKETGDNVGPLIIKKERSKGTQMP